MSFSRLFDPLSNVAGANIVHNIAMRAGEYGLIHCSIIFGAFLGHPYSWVPVNCRIGSEDSNPDLGQKDFLDRNWLFVSPYGIDAPKNNPMGPNAPSLSGLGCTRVKQFHPDVRKDSGNTDIMIRRVIKAYKRDLGASKNYHYWRGQSGFAFDVTTRTFKVVYSLVCGYDGYICTTVYMYTLGSGTWRAVDFVPAILRFRPDSSQVLLHGVLHWLTDNVDDPYKGCIGAINIATEKFDTIRPPLVKTNERKLAKYAILGTLGGYLTLFFDIFDDQFAIWVRKDYRRANFWTQQYFIKKETLGPLWSVPLKMFRMMKNGSVLLQGSDVLGYYDLEKKEFQPIPIHGVPSQSDQFEAVVHRGSLASPARIARGCYCWFDASLTMGTGWAGAGSIVGNSGDK
ncbi:hypothetical protein IFM89_013222 [Coptis chinensis]|uniref:F-box associated beta-propeller type 3 domain-containing protein n=1 Tax=Coptis chinensis TaxID=261450 RepID=A0A835M8Q3_9MAGN|nr:hypothetical protein IFM89_013222 [Coptis chinensis]